MSNPSSARAEARVPHSEARKHEPRGAGREEILIIDDDPAVVGVLRELLEGEKYRVRDVGSGAQAQRTLRTARPDLILLDLILPDVNGLDLCRRIKTDPLTARLPIIMLSAKDREADVVAGLEIGADDYIVKTSYSPAVMLARVRAALRRVSVAPGSATLDVDGLSIDEARHEAVLLGNPVDLTYSEFRILALFASSPGLVFTRDQILTKVRGDDYHVTDRAVDVQISGLRKKLGPWGGRIKAVRGIGYRLKG